ncbi:unnamed protein product [Peniophora sp. CBMAI 1063]|nr:unnamed protein product [Peniophora sp. CBMAI 1063]
MTTKPEGLSVYRQSERFAAGNGDVELLSSDGVVFKVHRANLASHSAVFPGQEMATNGELVPLTESSEVLGIILQYVYPSPPCQLDALSFGILIQVAEAAEKYQIFAVMEICRVLLEIRDYQEHPLEVLAYACRHGHTLMCDRVAPLTLAVEPREALRVLGPVHFAHWMLYREQWVAIRLSLPTYMDHELEYIKKHWGPCDQRWEQYQKICKEAALRGDILRCLREPDVFLAGVVAIDLTDHGCPGCTEYWDERRARLRRQVTQVRAFSAILPV